MQIAVSGSSLELPILLEYAQRLHNGSLSSRLGYLLEVLGQPTAGLEASKGPVKLDPQQPAGRIFNPHWQLYINRDQEDLFPQGVA